jgi:outer membrane protein assembly factor BamE (lipoprotein component of BamABCDE complex)|tara:strand:- start:7627 stop:8289 length:663 start_codon:yes stop_codon:yes gene_type:complete
MLRLEMPPPAALIKYFVASRVILRLGSQARFFNAAGNTTRLTLGHPPDFSPGLPCKEQSRIMVIRMLVSAVAGRRARSRITSGLLLVALLGLSACEYQVNVRGNMLDPDDVAEVLPGVSNRGDVSELLGSPSTVSTFEDQTWYYIGQRTEQLAFLAPETTDRSVLVVKFDDAGLVETTRLYTVEDGKVITPNTRKTPTQGNELTIIQQLIGNLGRFTPSE